MEKTTAAVNLLNLTAQAGLNTLPNIGKVDQSTSEISFADAFMKTSEVKPLESTVSEVSKTKTVTQTTASASKNIKTAENANGQNKESLDENKIKGLAEEVTKAVDEIKDKIKNEFDLSDEDIEKAMEILGLTSQNLFNATDLRSLVMELTETADSIELLTNVELYEGVKDVTALAENLLSEVSEEFGISNEQLTEIIGTESFEEVLSQIDNEVGTKENATLDIKAVTDEYETEDIETNASENIVAVEVKNDEKTADNNEISDDKIKAITEDSTKLNNVVKEKDEEPVKVEVKVEKFEEVKNIEQPVTDNSTNNNELMNQNSGNKKQNLFDNAKGQEVNLSSVQTVTTQTVNTVGDIVETVTSYSTYADTENIMRQVTDYVRVNITEDVTKMEMQLHPASLGTVNMQINSQNGQITAHLTVQNELVKSVLESQMIKLQETFNEQGTKVSAIEVSVASYNLDAKSDNNYSQERENTYGGSKKRNINLNEIGSFDDLTDEELLEAEVMEMNGSSVNYTA